MIDRQESATGHPALDIDLESMLVGPLGDLTGPDLTARRGAARAILRDVCAGVNDHTWAWGRQPRAVSALLRAAEDEDTDVATLSIEALDRLVRAYLPNAGTFTSPPTRARLGTDPEDTRRTAQSLMRILRRETEGAAAIAPADSAIVTVDTVLDHARELAAAAHVETARTLLLRAGFIDASIPRIQDAYSSVVPVPPELAAMRKRALDALSSADPEMRLRASRAVMSDTHRAVNRTTWAWCRDPGATDALMSATSDDVATVARNATVSLRRVVVSYFADQRVERCLVDRLDATDPESRSAAVEGLLSLRGWDALDRIAPRFTDGDRRVRRAAVGLVGLNVDFAVLVPGRVAATLRPLLTPALSDRSDDVRRAAADSLLRLGDL